jgi:hypothetical protein
VSTDDEERDGGAEIERLEREFANLMAHLDREKGFGADLEVSRAHEADIDPMLERDLQLVLARYLAKHGAPNEAGDADARARLGDGDALEQALETRVAPLFEALMSTALDHARAASEAVAAGRDPSTRKVAELTLDLSDILEDDSEEDS